MVVETCIVGRKLRLRQMIKSIMFAPVEEDISIDFSEIIYVNTFSNFVAEKYCILRADLVIFLEKPSGRIKLLTDMCDYFKILNKNVITDNIELQNERRIALIGTTKDSNHLNNIYKILRDFEKNDLEVYTSGVRKAGIKIVEKLIKRKNKCQE